MCLSKVYDIRDDGEKLVFEYVTDISLDNGVITLTDITGAEMVINGVLKSIDLAGNIIKIIGR